MNGAAWLANQPENPPQAPTAQRDHAGLFYAWGQIMSEHKIQNEGRNALARPGVFCTRANVGRAWAGDAFKLPNGDLLLKNPRPFDTGLPKGFTDTFGVVQRTVTPDMVGQTIAVPFFIEYKDDKGRLSPIQAAFLAAMTRLGARAGVARSADQAVAIALGNDA